MSKLNNKQREAIEVLVGEIMSWQLSNDLSSPSHISDMKEEMDTHTNKLSDLDKVAVIKAAKKLLKTIQSLK